MGKAPWCFFIYTCEWVGIPMIVIMHLHTLISLSKNMREHLQNSKMKFIITYHKISHQIGMYFFMIKMVSSKKGDNLYFINE